MNGYEKENWMAVPKRITDALLKASSILIMAHQKPDGDAIGSMIALGKGLKQLGKIVHYAVDVPIEEKLQSFNETTFFNKNFQACYDAAVFLDCSSYDYAVKPDAIWKANEILVIDHHKSNTGYGDINFIEETSATAELIYRILLDLGANIDDEMADALYTGISTDCGQFQYVNVTWQTHEIISRLYQIKPNFTALSKQLHSIKNPDQFKLYGIACDSLELLEDGKIAWVTLSYHDVEAHGGAVNITDDIASLGVNVKGTILAVTLKETSPFVYRVSLRSVDPWPVDVSVFAARYGGGGHYRAAGFTWKQDLDLLKKEILIYFRACML